MTMTIVRKPHSFDVTINETGATFVFRYLSIRHMRKIAKTFDDAMASKTADGAIAGMIAVLQAGLRSWSNLFSDDPSVLDEFGIEASGKPVELPFRIDLIDVAVDTRFMLPLGELFMKEQSPGVADVPNSASPVTSQQALSAAIASEVPVATSASA